MKMDNIPYPPPFSTHIFLFPTSVKFPQYIFDSDPIYSLSETILDTYSKWYPPKNFPSRLRFLEIRNFVTLRAFLLR